MEKRKMELRLNSPAGGDPVVYSWPLTKSKQYDPAGEIMETIRFVMREYGELKEVMEKVVKIKEVNTSNYESMKSLCDKFSKAADTIRNLWRWSTRPNNPDGSRASKALLQHIVQQVYNRSVIDPEKLNHYPAFSPETYGETTFEMVSKILEEIKPTEKDVFVDLGSGVGQVVIHVAAGSKCKKCIGIEKADIPCRYAENMQCEFVRWMKWYGKKYRPFELKKGNFLDPEFRQLIAQEATIIFVNNFAFGPELDQELKLIFQDLKPHTKIVSSKSFCKESKSLTHRHMTDLSAIMDVRELTPVPSSVSWTCTNVVYYLHTVNPSKLEKYFFASDKGKCLASEFHRSSSSKGSSKSSSRDSSRSRDNSLHRVNPHSTNPNPSETEENKIPFGPTTRRQWNDWVSQQEKVKKEMQKKDTTITIAQPKPKRSQSQSSDSNNSSSGKRQKKKKSFKEPVVREEVAVLKEESEDFSIKKELLQPAQKKVGPGRPRKSQAEIKAKETKRKYKKQRVTTNLSPVSSTAVTPPRKHEELIKQLDVLHKCTIDSYTPVGGDIQPSPGDMRISNLKETRYPDLDSFLDRIREAYMRQLDYMQTPEFRSAVVREIQEERDRQERLKQRREHLERQVKNLQEEGVRLLKLRMSDLNITAETPAELLNQSKQIVLLHKELQNEANRLTAEVANLERQNQILGFPSRLSVDTAKDLLLTEIGMHFNRQRALVNEIARMESEVIALQTNISPALIPLLEHHHRTITAMDSAKPAQVQTTQALAPSTAHRTSKRGRARGAQPRKRLTATSSNGGGGRKIGDSDPKKQEEIERHDP